MEKKKYDITGVGYTAIDYLGIIPRFPDEIKGPSR